MGTIAATAFSSNSLFDFGSLAQDYDRWYLTPEGQAYDRVQKTDVLALLPHPHRDERLLDVGCGTGHWSKFFGSFGYTVVGVDISERMIEIASNIHASDCIFQLGDACHLPFEDCSFDVVTAMATLEFVSNVSCALEEMFRCVKEGGSVLIGTLNRLAPINMRRLAEGREPYASGRLFSPKELHALLKRFGPVRMAGSSLTAGESSRWFWKRIMHWIIPGRLQLEGPFIVAEVNV